MTDGVEVYRPGLDGVIAGETAVSCVEQGQLLYRGYDVTQLAERATFEEVAYLLLHAALPTRAQLERFRALVDGNRALPAPVLDALAAIPPKTDMMDVLRTGLSLAAHFAPAEDELHSAARLVGIVPSLIAARLRLLEKQTLLSPKEGLSHAAQFYWLAFGKPPTELEERILNLTLILYAEHEFNASTFAARVITSTQSDLYSAVVGAVGALKGPLHGGANEEACRLITRFQSAEEAHAWVLDSLGRKQLIMGFGHRVYKNGDHRARILERETEKLATARGATWRMDVYRAIKDTVWDQKQLHINLDFPCGLAYFLLDLPIGIYTPLFVASRVTGWCAHILEQRASNRLIRPRSQYIGPALRPFVPLDERR